MTYDTVAFRVDGESAISVEVNGRPLAELVGEVERPFAEREGSPDIAGNYAGIGHRWIDDVDEHYHGAPGSDLSCGSKDKTLLLGCECGEPGCWPLLARVDASSEIVSWEDFEQPHRGERWSYDQLRPFTFERAQYDAALSELRRTLAAQPAG
jgi:hypothetical protein